MNYKERIISGSFANFPDIKIEFGYNGIEAVIVYNDITFCEPVTVMLTGKVSMVYHNSELAYVRYYDIPVIDRFLDNLSAKDYVGSLTFGADPELEIVDSNNVCRDASKILGIDVARPDDIIGVDGHTSTAEIRPRPGTALEVVDNISYIIESLANNYGEYYWRVGSDFEACGGHVHIGFKHSSFISQVGNNITYLLDMVWGERVRKLAGVARRYTRYNCNGAWRRQNWGIEYRTPSASWLHNRQLTESVIEFTKVVMEKLFTSGVIIPRSRLIKKELQALFGKELVNKFFAGIRQYKASNKDVIDGWGIERKPSIWCIQYVGDWDIERYSLLCKIYTI